METTSSAKIAELEQQIAALREQDKQERRAKLDATPVIMRYSVRPVEGKYDKVWDETIVLYRVEGKVVNADEAKAAGHGIERRDGGQTYLFNTTTGRFIMPLSGGRIVIGGFSSDPQTVEDTRVFGQLAKFVLDNPEGGDITDLVEEHQARKAEERRLAKEQRGR